ncbi:MAG: zinc ribbon domain-containing protein [Acidobacteriota bacterium]
MKERFEEVEKKFEELKKKRDTHLISDEEWKEELRKLIIRDDDGKFWMVGALSGKWHYYDGKQWIQTDPPYKRVEPEFKECPFCGFENPVKEKICVRCGKDMEQLEREKITCSNCNFVFLQEFKFCPNCGQSVEGEEEEMESKKITLKINQIKILSAFFFFGGIGLIAGIIAGALFGVMDRYWNDLILLPDFLTDFRGKFMGGFIFGSLGAIGGFVGFGILGSLLSLFLNFLFFIFGGIKITYTKE